jgi:cytidylate kinase
MTNSGKGNCVVPVIAIDGPSASGKGTVAERVAASLGFHYLDSGAIYRVVALAAARAGMAIDNEDGLTVLATALRLEFGNGRILLDDADVTEAIRSEEVSRDAGRISAFPKLRTALMARQLAFRRVPGLVADGRDMGSVVFPDALLKIFLSASLEVRAERRYKQLKQKGMCANLAAILEELRLRDQRDSTRSAAPLKKCDDAVELDTSDLTIEQAVAYVLEKYRSASRAIGVR